MHNQEKIDQKLDSKTLSWVMSTYFAQGFPFTVIRILSGVFFTDIGVKERFIGYLNFLNVPWNFKFTWAPLLDSIGTTRKWQIWMQLALTALLLALSILCIYAGQATDSSPYILVAAIIFIVMGFLAATNDIAIDAYYMEGLSEPRSQALYSGYRVLAYRLAMVYVRSGIVAVIAAVAAINSNVGVFPSWSIGFAAAGISLALISIFHSQALPHFSLKDKKVPSFTETIAGFKTALSSYLDQEKIWLTLLFVVLYKIGDEILFSMVTPFLMRELGLSKGDYAWISGVVGASGAVLGTMAGGWWIKRVGLKRAILPLTLVMNLAVWFYIVLAWAKPDGGSLSGIGVIAAVHFIEQLAAGLGSAALLIFLLGTCKPEHKAAHYAVGSAIMSIPSTVVGGYAGRFVENWGYLNLFLTAFIASIPAVILLWVVPMKGQR